MRLARAGVVVSNLLERLQAVKRWVPWTCQATCRSNSRRSRRARLWSRGDIGSCGLGMAQSAKHASSKSIKCKDIWESLCRKSSSSRKLSILNDIGSLIFKLLLWRSKKKRKTNINQRTRKSCSEIYWTVTCLRQISRTSCRRTGNMPYICKRVIGYSYFAPERKRIETCGWLGSDIFLPPRSLFSP